MSSLVESLAIPRTQIDPPEEEQQRGRKRRRSSAALQIQKVPSNGIRGRGRHRSLSPSHCRSQNHTAASTGSLNSGTAALEATKNSPGQMYQKQFLEVVQETKKRRSQSPSRSRSFGHEGDTKPRRRQRTHSRSRSHGKENLRTDEDSASYKSADFHAKLIQDAAAED